MDRQHIATFPNRGGRRLVGIVHEPLDHARRDVGILLLSPGVKNRVGPHRLYNKLAAECASLGFWVLRFDFEGLGDSEGEVVEPLLADFYASIQVGRYVDDTRCAMDWMRRTYGIPRFVLGGLCGGAITGLLAADDDAAVAGLLGLGIPVILDGSNVDRLRNLTAGQMGAMRSRYVRKLLSPAAWRRLLTFRTDFRLLARVLSSSRPTPPQSAAPAGVAPSPATGDNTNPHFAPALLRMVSSGRPVLLVFGGADRLYFEYKEKFLARHEAQAAGSASLDVAVVEQANHVFTFGAWQDQVLATSRSWLMTRFPMPETAGAATGSDAVRGAGHRQ